MPLTPPAKRRITAVVVVVLAVVGARSTFFQGLDSARWKAASSVQNTHEADFRRHMYLDLWLFRRLKGKTREEVIVLLGPPTNKHSLTGHEMVYGMGIDRTLKYVWLVLDFEGQTVHSIGRVTSD